MREFSTIVTKAGQITLPAEIRRLLDIEAGDRVTFQVEGSNVSLAPAKWTLETVTGSVRSPRKGLEIEEAIRLANDEMASKVVRQMNGE